MARLPPLSSIANALLKSSAGEEVAASSLWAASPVLVFALRRPGCILCRDTAMKVWGARDELEAAGVQLVCVAHEWIDREITAFHTEEFWPGPLYHDVDKAFYKVFSEDGKSLRTQSVLSLLNPFSPAWRRIMAARSNVADHNTIGEGTILGGLLLVKAGDGGIACMHAERTFGEFPEIDKIVADVKAALGK